MEKCWTCGKRIKEGSSHLHFCSTECQKAYSIDHKTIIKKQSLERIKEAKKALWTIPCPYCNETLDLATGIDFCPACGHEIHEILFFISKPDSSEEAYTFSYKAKEGLITGFTARRSGKFPNSKVFDKNGLLIGEIRGNLLFTRWGASVLSEAAKITKNTIETQLGIYTIEKQSAESISVMDSNRTRCFNIHSLDKAVIQSQQQKRNSRDHTEIKNFRVLSNGKYNPCFIFLASIYILEQMFRPLIRHRKSSRGP